MPLALRVDFDAAGLRMAARRSKNAAQARRLLALAAIYDGATRTGAGCLPIAKASRSISLFYRLIQTFWRFRQKSSGSIILL